MVPPLTPSGAGFVYVPPGFVLLTVSFSSGTTVALALVRYLPGDNEPVVHCMLTVAEAPEPKVIPVTTPIRVEFQRKDTLKVSVDPPRFATAAARVIVGWLRFGLEAVRLVIAIS